VKHSQILRLAIALFLCRAAIGALVIQPWQGPDEPPHYVVAEQVAARSLGNLAARAQLERDVLRSMADHEWWRGYRLATPTPVPTSFAQEPEHLGSGNMTQPVYYLVAGSVLRAVRVSGLDRRYYVLRLLSVLLGVATILMAWAGARLLFDATTASVVAFMFALHPQFLFTALSVEPDALANAFGALAWWQGARFVVRGRWTAALIALTAAVLALLTKRSGVPLLGVALVIVAFGVRRHVRWSPRTLAATTSAATVAVGLAMIIVLTSAAEAVVTLRSGWYATLFQFHAVPDFSARRIVEFSEGLLDSSWLVAGWLRYPAPPWWLATVRLLTFAGFAGAIVASGRRRELRIPLGVAAVSTGALIVAVFVSGLMTGAGAQGRYLFIVAAPFAVLLWVGFAEWWPEDRRWLAAPALIALLVALDIAGWITTLLPAYV
jgi:hypothetical protein